MGRVCWDDHDSSTPIAGVHHKNETIGKGAQSNHVNRRAVKGAQSNHVNRRVVMKTITGKESRPKDCMKCQPNKDVNAMNMNDETTCEEYEGDGAMPNDEAGTVPKGQSSILPKGQSSILGQQEQHDQIEAASTIRVDPAKIRVDKALAWFTMVMNEMSDRSGMVAIEFSDQVGATEVLVRYYPMEEMLVDTFTEPLHGSILLSFYMTVLNIQGLSRHASRTRPQECVEEHERMRTDGGSRSKQTQRRLKLVKEQLTWNDRRGMKLHVECRNKGAKVGGFHEAATFF
jgi:hypothetical protein